MYIDEKVLASPIWYRIFVVFFAIYCQKAKFYLTWTLADAVNNASGFGFNGYDSNGATKWNLIKNIKIRKLEVNGNIFILHLKRLVLKFFFVDSLKKKYK